MLTPFPCVVQFLFLLVILVGRLQTYAELMEAGIPCTPILDSAVGLVMPTVNTVLVGAEGVFESGGILNSLGTSTLAMTAKACNKPFYVCAETCVPVH